MTDKELEELIALHQETTGSQWTAWSSQVITNDINLSDGSNILAELPTCDDAQFIVEAHRLVPKLVEEIRRLRKQLNIKDTQNEYP